MKLNPKKCAFGMREGTFLGYKVDADGLRVCPDKVEAVLNLPSPKCLKEVQRLNGKLASLNRFLSKSVEKSLPFFKTLKCTKKSDFQWTAEAEMAFKQMKKLIAELPMLTALKEKEELIMYLVAAKEAISAVLMTEMDGKQTPIYFVSRALQGPEVNHTPMEKLILALHDIHYRPRTSVKGQILADFIVERPEDDPLDTLIEDKEELPDRWILFTDESSCIEGFGAGLIITNPKGMEFTYALRFRFNVTNNEAEYEALIAGLRIAEQMGVKNLQANADSKLVANQVNGVYVAKELGMIKYLEKVKNLSNAFKEFSIKQVPRGENKKADALSKMTSTSFAHLSKQVLVEELKEKSIDENEVLAVVEKEGRTWMTLIYEYLIEEILPEEKRKARAIRRKADATNLIRECSSCQVHRPVPRNPQQKLTPITSLWPFYKWGIDIAGPFPEGPRKVKFLIVAIDYFTKWIEAKPVATITGAQFRDNPFKYWCEKLCIRQCFASVKHPQANGLVERENRSLGEGIKARLDERSKKLAGRNITFPIGVLNKLESIRRNFFNGVDGTVRKWLGLVGIRSWLRSIMEVSGCRVTLLLIEPSCSNGFGVFILRVIRYGLVGEGGVANGGGMEEAGGGGGGGRRVEMVEVANSCGHSSDHHRYDQWRSLKLFRKRGETI
ncbi:reverse transcriptase domain-containing protein [Tanacetum coccineum]